ncbi:MAG: hypothetical protein PHU23_15875 [Dehalococcoidales bacterium]|nr:hypothetical protein [Dehalococcoidales bacterium]
MNTNNLAGRADQLIELGQGVLKTTHCLSGESREWIDTGKIKGFRAASLSFIEMLYSREHSYYIEFDKVTDGYHPEHVESGIEIIRSIRDEIAGGWLINVKGLITAEVFSDFFEMAEHLLSNGYKDAAAVLIGSTLEEHLRQLCIRNSIEAIVKINGDDVAKKADTLNAELAKANIYNKLDQKNVTAWLDLRNKAAHGKYDEYNREQVEIMLRGVSEFCARTVS